MEIFMLRTILKHYIYELGLNIMFESIQKNFAKPVFIAGKDPDLFIEGELLRLISIHYQEIMFRYHHIGIDDDGNKYFCGLDSNGNILEIPAKEILMFDRLDYNVQYTADGKLEDWDDISDDELVEWLEKKKREIN